MIKPSGLHESRPGGTRLRCATYRCLARHRCVEGPVLKKDLFNRPLFQDTWGNVGGLKGPMQMGATIYLAWQDVFRKPPPPPRFALKTLNLSRSTRGVSFALNFAAIGGREWLKRQWNPTLIKNIMIMKLGLELGAWCRSSNCVLKRGFDCIELINSIMSVSICVEQHSANCVEWGASFCAKLEELHLRWIEDPHLPFALKKEGRGCTFY